MFKRFRGEYTLIGFIAVLVAIAVGVLDLPSKLHTFKSVMFSDGLISIANPRDGQRAFDRGVWFADHTIGWMHWEGVFEIGNDSETDIGIRNIEVNWNAAMLDRGDTLRLAAFNAGDNGGLVEAYNSMAEFRQVDNAPDGDRSRIKMDRVEHFPIMVHAHSKRVLVVWYRMGIMHGNNVVSATDESLLFSALAKILGFSGDDGKCSIGEMKDYDVILTTTDNRSIRKRIPLLVLVPGCEVRFD